MPEIPITRTPDGLPGDDAGASTPAGSAPAAGAFSGADRRVDRVDDAEAVSAMDDAQGIDPRELDALVRLEEGATVDDAAPVGGVRYDAEPHVAHDYGRPDEAYGPEYGSGRIGVDHVVSRPDETP